MPQLIRPYIFQYDSIAGIQELNTLAYFLINARLNKLLSVMQVGTYPNLKKIKLIFV